MIPYEELVDQWRISNMEVGRVASSLELTMAILGLYRVGLGVFQELLELCARSDRLARGGRRRTMESGGGAPG